MEEVSYTQCLLKNKDYRQVAYIPTQFAEVGKVLMLQEDDGDIDSWEVMETYGSLSSDENLFQKNIHRIFRYILY